MKMKPPSGPKNKPNSNPISPKGQNELKIACRKIWLHPIIGVQPQMPCYVRDGLYTNHAQDGIYTDYLVPLVAIHSFKVNWRQE